MLSVSRRHFPQSFLQPFESENWCYLSFEEVMVHGGSDLIRDTQVDLYAGLSDSKAHGEEFWLKSPALISNLNSPFTSE